MESLVTIAVIIVIVAVAFPIYGRLRNGAHKQVALERMKTLGGAISTYVNQNNGLLPMEDSDGNDTWSRIASPQAKDAWYNALPRALGKKGAGDFSPSDYYSEDNMLVLPGANYADQKKFIQPQFAIAFNTKLHRNDPAGKKERLKLDQVKDPARTVAFLEQGLLNEDRSLPVQTKSDYDGSPKGSPKSFVGRYGGHGVLCFLDGHTELVKATDLLTETGYIPFPPTDVIWAATPEEDPNKDAQSPTRKK